MPKARSLVDVILGEAASGSPAKRYADMKAIASTIVNRARALGVTPDQVVANSREFNAYGRSLPAGVDSYRSLAQQALDDVAANGPSHSGTFYATPNAAGNLPKGLKQETATAGHNYYSDPQNRAIGTSLGYRQPRQPDTASQAIDSILAPQDQPATVNERMGLLNAYSAPEQEPQMAQNTLPTRSVKTISYFKPEPEMSLDTLQQNPSPLAALAAQYASYGAGKAAPQMAGLLSQDVAYQGLINGLTAQKQQLQAGVDPMEDAEPWKQQPETVQAPMGDVQPVEVPQVQPVSYEQTGSVPGLLSQQEQQMFDAQKAKLDWAPVNHRPQIAGAVKGILGTLGGGILGGLLAGPVGAIGGGMLAKSMVTPGGIGNRDFPKKPDSKPRGDGKETDYGRSVRESSHQYDRAVRNGGVGLY